jgi:monoamine oxidase
MGLGTVLVEDHLPAAATKRFDIAIVGAGAAGLAAARILSRAGAFVALLEARSRIGGRAWTRRAPGWPIPLELGAEFVHGRNDALFREADDAGLRMMRLPEANVELRGSRLRPMGDIWTRLDAITRKIPRSGADRSVADFLRGRGKTLAAADRRLLVSLVEGYDAAPIETASLHALSTAGKPPLSDDDRAEFRLVDGYGALVDRLSSRIDPVHCKLFRSTIVKSIVWRRGRVRLATDGGDFLAERALITVSIGVLRATSGSAGAIAFDPDPPSLRRALAGLAMGDAARLVLRFREQFWREAPRVARARSSAGLCGNEPSFFHFPSAPFPTWWTSAPVEAPVLTAWAGGPAARSVLRLPPPGAVDRALETLAGALDLPLRPVAGGLVDWDLHDWTADPFSRGAYSYALVGGASAAQALARPIAGTLYFAGEAMGGSESGTVPGAIESGRRAARRMLR